MAAERNAYETRAEHEAEIEALLAQLTLEEKIGMIHGAGLFRTAGVERLSIPPLVMSDGPMGVRAEFADNEWRTIGTTDDYVSYLPCNSAVASTWNRTLAKRAGEVLGAEARGRGKDVILAPGINIKRSPLCGRNFEYMSEDPYLISELVLPMVEGIQENDVAACVKHFAVNVQETERLWVDTEVLERALEEIYFPGFRAAVRGGVYALMGAYNRLNGAHCCTGKKLLNDTLRRDWGFDGLIVSDWGGVHDTGEAAESALDVEMDVTADFDGYYMAQALLEKVRAGEIAEALIDEKVRNVLRLMFRLHMIGEGRAGRKSGTYNSREHRDAALDIARESVILLKNEEALLPLDEKKVKKVAVIGQNAAAIHSNGGGSAEIKALYEVSPLLGIKELLGGNVQVCYAPGYEVPTEAPQGELNWQADSTKKDGGTASGKPEEACAGKPEEVCAGKPEEACAGESGDAAEDRSAAYRQAALQLAKECDTVIFVGGLNHTFDSEGRDRKDLALPYGQDALIEALLAVNPDTVVVLLAGSPVAMPWKERAKAILFCYYAGMEGGYALAETLFGRVNPSGKLAESFPASIAQCPAHSIGTFGEKDVVRCAEGVMVGYRHYDTVGTELNFCFGHGLSYSRFVYRDMKVVPAEEDGGAGAYTVSVTVKNDSKIGGSEVVQFYAAPLSGNGEQPHHALCGFRKIWLDAGAECEVCVLLTKRAFSYYDENVHAFVLWRGGFEIQAGSSARDIRLRRKIEHTCK